MLLDPATRIDHFLTTATMLRSPMVRHRFFSSFCVSPVLFFSFECSFRCVGSGRLVKVDARRKKNYGLKVAFCFSLGNGRANREATEKRKNRKCRRPSMTQHRWPRKVSLVSRKRSGGHPSSKKTRDKNQIQPPQTRSSPSTVRFQARNEKKKKTARKFSLQT